MDQAWKPTREDLHGLWANAANWNAVGLYRAAADPRLIVPKRRRAFGWTVNAAHPVAWLLLAAMIAVVAGVPALLVALGVHSRAPLLSVAVLSVIVIVAVSHWESTRTR